MNAVAKLSIATVMLCKFTIVLIVLDNCKFAYLFVDDGILQVSNANG